MSLALAGGDTLLFLHAFPLGSVDFSVQALIAYFKSFETQLLL